MIGIHDPVEPVQLVLGEVDVDGGNPLCLTNIALANLEPASACSAGPGNTLSTQVGRQYPSFNAPTLANSPLDQNCKCADREFH